MIDYERKNNSQKLWKWNICYHVYIHRSISKKDKHLLSLWLYYGSFTQWRQCMLIFFFTKLSSKNYSKFLGYDPLQHNFPEVRGDKENFFSFVLSYFILCYLTIFFLVLRVATRAIFKRKTISPAHISNS